MGFDVDLFSEMPCDLDGPTFSAPWEAQAFAMAVRLHEAGVFEWTEWAVVLSSEIERAQRNGDPDLGDTYYLHWLNALEALAAEKGLVGLSELATRKEAWRDAYRATPHGQPVTL
ncbi:MAG: hypothetical protein CFH10_00320 [Alphaproteobacteria bacterium MarineAlpha4_Bin2]|nr:MAG: hypothetical protein CFH10_00320 [Alphaproteobacteria bacterium MarineAlpha4_Bin2]